MDSGPGHEHSFKIYWFFLTEEEFSNYFSSFFSLIFMQQLHEPFRDKNMFDNLSFLTVQSRVFRATVFCCKYFARIRILSTGSIKEAFVYCQGHTFFKNYFPPGGGGGFLMLEEKMKNWYFLPTFFFLRE